MPKTRFKWRPEKKADPGKLSAIMLEYAQGFFGWAKGSDEKQSMLNLACNAWNIANLREAAREGAVQDCLKEYQQVNPNINDVNNLEHNLRKLIERKLLLFSNDTRYIVDAKIETSEGKETLHVASFRKDG